MNCSAIHTQKWTEEAGGPVRVSALVVLTLCGCIGNISTWIRLTLLQKRGSVYEYLLKTQCIWGGLLLMSTVPVHTAVLVLGNDGLNESTCGGCGMLTQTILGTWTTLQAIVLLERYTKVSKPSEHLALFSDVNIKLMLWGTVVVHAMISLGPIYGWGHYTHANEHYRFTLTPVVTVTNSTSEYLVPVKIKNVTLINDQINDANTTNLLPGHKVQSALFYATPHEIQLDLMLNGGQGILCTQREYNEGQLGEKIFHSLTEWSVTFREQLGNKSNRLKVELDDKSLLALKRRDHIYSGSTACEVNYQSVSGNDDFYVLLTFALELLCPLVLVFYFSARIVFHLWISARRLDVILTNKEYEYTIESLLSCNVVLALVGPYFGCNLAIRDSHVLTSAVHFAVRFLLYSSALSVMIIHVCFNREDLLDEWRNFATYCNRNKTQKGRGSTGEYSQDGSLGDSVSSALTSRNDYDNSRV